MKKRGGSELEKKTRQKCFATDDATTTAEKLQMHQQCEREGEKEGNTYTCNILKGDKDRATCQSYNRLGKGHKQT